ncbi:hypothetical protein [Streptomyces sp. NK08204]|nr:hypothetical protein [Streptomyces sp. NK08204]
MPHEHDHDHDHDHARGQATARATTAVRPGGAPLKLAAAVTAYGSWSR